MYRQFALATLAAAISFGSGAPAQAEVIDAATVTCQELSNAEGSGNESEAYGMSTLLYWLAGYNATDEQGTVVDFEKLGEDIQKIVEYCGENPNIGLMTAASKHLGENASEATGAAYDLATIKCERLINSDGSESDQQGLGQILMWFAGYHASDDSNSQIDFDDLLARSEKIGKYCGENPQAGLATAVDNVVDQ